VRLTISDTEETTLLSRQRALPALPAGVDPLGRSRRPGTEGRTMCRPRRNGALWAGQVSRSALMHAAPFPLTGPGTRATCGATRAGASSGTGCVADQRLGRCKGSFHDWSVAPTDPAGCSLNVTLLSDPH
jgi:hypothetical protein